MASSALLPSSQKAQKPTQNKKQNPNQQQKAQVGGRDNTNETEKEKEDEFQNRPRQKAINSLEPTLHILERFHHRNKNQHRRSKWWAEADMLRRQVKKFIEALHDGLEAEERANRIMARASKNPAAGMKMKGKSGKENDLEDGLVKDKFGIYERGFYLRGVLVPRAWLAFSQVVADERFAQLGLMLLATLAQVDQVVSAFAPGPDVDEEDDDLGDSVDSAPNQEISSVGETAVIEDVGVAISREEFIMTTMSVRTGGASAQGGERKTRERTIISVETDGDVDDDGEFEGFDDDAPSSMLDPVSTMTETCTDKGPATAVVEEESSIMKSTTKKTKKKRPRDEEEEEQLSREEGIEDDDIGSIFASLVPTTKKKKRSTKATAGRSSVASSQTPKASVEEEPSKLDDDNGDEIGSIFSSLVPKTKKTKSSTPASASASASASTPTTTTTSKIKTKSKEKEKEKKKKKRQGDEFDDIFGGLV
ncbi:hypothetical protein V8F06_008814 [Rhypophila decipiens]